MTPITWTAALVAAASLAGGALPNAVDRSASTPDFCQTDPAADFGGKGGVFCGPVAVANSLMYLAESGFPKVRPEASTDKEAQIVLVHDPAPRTGMKPLTQRVRLAVIDEGVLQRNVTSDKIRRRDARGFFEMKGEMKLKPGADAAILDTAVVLLIKSSCELNQQAYRSEEQR